MRQTTLTRAINNNTTKSAIIARLCSQTSASVAGEIIDLLASVPGCLESFWTSIEPAYTSCYVRTSANELLHSASLEAKSNFHLPNHLTWLQEHEYSREDTRQIRYVVEAFYNSEPRYAILAALALKWLCDTQSDLTCSECDWSGTHPTFNSPISLAEQSSVNNTHKFYRAISIWPGYSQQVSEEFSSQLRSSEDSLLRLMMILDKLINNIPIRPSNDISIEDSLDLKCSIHHYLIASREVILLTSALRRMFIKAETEARVKRISQNAC